LQHFLQLRKLSWAARKAFAGHMRPMGRMLCRPGTCHVFTVLQKLGFAWDLPTFHC